MLANLAVRRPFIQTMCYGHNCLFSEGNWTSFVNELFGFPLEESHGYLILWMDNLLHQSGMHEAL